MLTRRRWLATSAAAGLGGNGLAALTGCRNGASRLAGDERGVVALRDVDTLIVERIDPLSGRCRYVAVAGSRRVGHPIFVARTGDEIEAVIENRLPQPTTVHFHGLVLPEAADGAGFDSIAPGASKRVRFGLRNRSGLYWLHPHPHGLTAEQTHAGLASLLVVTDDDDAAVDAALALPLSNRLALALSDVRYASGAILPYAPTAEDCLRGWLGNRMLVNGEFDARFDVAPGWVRLQLLNACNARGLLLAFVDGKRTVPFQLLGTDGGLLAAPFEVDRVFVYPAERIDIAIDLTGSRALTARSLPFDPRWQAQHVPPMRRHPVRERYPPLAEAAVCASADDLRDGARVADGAPLSLFELRVNEIRRRSVPTLPRTLSSLDDPSVADMRARRIRLDFDERDGFLIDATPYRIDERGVEVARGKREIWEVKNSPISTPHPMHLHGRGFRVLRRQGTYGPARQLAKAPGGRLPTDLGTKDTVVVWPNETVWLEVDFALPAAPDFVGRQRYLFHCHNLEHEDALMMRNLVIF
jgi:FtsP/CotA-like multicopper oxidase with cupredoxin domain